MKELIIKNLYVEIDGKQILKNINLQINEGETHALVGPNGNGKSTLLSAVMGHPRYKITKGTITMNNKNLLEMSVDERSRAGLFLAMQYPQEIPGITNSDFLRSAINARREKPIPLFTFIKEMEKSVKDLEMKSNLAHRFLNEGFSGGEKKRNEIVQMKMLKPDFAMLDEIDSGLDVDAIKVVSKTLNEIQASENKVGMLIVSHYERFYQLVKPTHVHVLVNGEIVVNGGYDLIKKIDDNGYDWIYEKYGVNPIMEDDKPALFSLGSCAAADKSK
ncbi:MAG: Fe-S cluster assembly ATPase SufC [Anaerorhabdus sp.]